MIFSLYKIITFFSIYIMIVGANLVLAGISINIFEWFFNRYVYKIIKKFYIKNE